MKVTVPQTRPALVNEFGDPLKARADRQQGANPDQMHARYENAFDTVDNQRLWKHAQLFNPAYVTDQTVRWKLIGRSQYTYRNNSYCQGMCLTLANDTIGTGPRLQLVSADPANQDAANRLEKEFMMWADEIGFANKLWQMRIRRLVDGESFAVEEYNPKLMSPVKLDLRLYDAGHWYSINKYPNREGDRIYTDGIIFDQYLNPVTYERQAYDYFSSVQYLSNYQDATYVPAEYVYHWFRKENSEQFRGVPEISSVLHLYEELRRYSLATLAAAETAADLAVVLSTNNPYMGECQAITSSANAQTTDRAFELVDLPRRSMMIAPEGWMPSQIKSEQPVNTYDTYTASIIREIARCLNMPFNVAAGDSSQYNYASGRLDHQTYYRAIDIDRRECERQIMTRLFHRWYEERQLVDIPMPRTGIISQINWTWPVREHVDPAKEANAVATLEAAGLLDYDRYWNQMNLSSDEALARQAKYIERRRELGLSEESDE